MQAIQQTWLNEITMHIKKKNKNKQRRKKTVIGKDLHKELLVYKNTNPTVTYDTNEYGNLNEAATIKKTIFDMDRLCFSTKKSYQDTLVAQTHILFDKSGDQYDELVEMFNESYFDSTKYYVFLTSIIQDEEKYRNSLNFEWDTETLTRLLTNRERVLENMFIPPELQHVLTGASKMDKQRLLKLIQDTDLRDLLYKLAPNSKNTTERFIESRIVSFVGDFSPDLLRHITSNYPMVNVNTLTSSDKCTLNLLFRIKSLIDEPPHANRNKIELPTITFDDIPEEFSVLTSPEKANILMSAAIRLYTSGLALLEKGFKEEKISYIIRGYNNITGVMNTEYCSAILQSKRRGAKHLTLAERCPYFKPGHDDNSSNFVCDKLRPDVVTASHAFLMAYMYLYEWCVSPPPPLMTKAQFRVNELFKKEDGSFERFEENDYNNWSIAKKKDFGIKYKYFLKYWMHSGFTLTNRVGPHNQPLLNFDAWGKGFVVPNPRRVQGYAAIQSKFRQFILEPNRLGMGQVARDVWLRHQVRFDFDPSWCIPFMKTGRYPRDSWFPRPVFDHFFYLPLSMRYGDTDAEYPYSRLGFNVSSFDEYGPRIASLRVDKLKTLDFTSFAFDRTEPILALFPEIEQLNDNKEFKLTREADAMNDFHKNFRKLSIQMPFIQKNGQGMEDIPFTFTYDIPVLKTKVLYRPIFDTGKNQYVFGKQGAERNPEAWKDKPTRATHYTSGDEKIDRVYTEQLPTLFNRLQDPVTNILVNIRDILDQPFDEALPILKLNSFTSLMDKKPKIDWMYWDRVPGNDTHVIDREYPFPVLNEYGLVDPVVGFLPIGHSETGLPPFTITNTHLYTLLPNRKNKYWDIRNSLFLLLKGRYFKKFLKVNIALIEHLGVEDEKKQRKLPENTWNFKGYMNNWNKFDANRTEHTGNVKFQNNSPVLTNDYLENVVGKEDYSGILRFYQKHTYNVVGDMDNQNKNIIYRLVYG